MTPVNQTKFGVGGNCLAACLASIFSCELDSLPDMAPPACFTDPLVQARIRRQWLALHGLDYLEINIAGHVWVQGAIPEGPVLFAVESPTPEMRAKGYGHFVVGQLREVGTVVEYQILHDPLGTIAAEYKIVAIGIICRLTNPPDAELQSKRDLELVRVQLRQMQHENDTLRSATDIATPTLEQVAVAGRYCHGSIKGKDFLAQLIAKHEAGKDREIARLTALAQRKWWQVLFA